MCQASSCRFWISSMMFDSGNAWLVIQLWSELDLSEKPIWYSSDIQSSNMILHSNLTIIAHLNNQDLFILQISTPKQSSCNGCSSVPVRSARDGSPSTKECRAYRVSHWYQLGKPNTNLCSSCKFNSFFRTLFPRKSYLFFMVIMYMPPIPAAIPDGERSENKSWSFWPWFCFRRRYWWIYFEFPFFFSWWGGSQFVTQPIAAPIYMIIGTRWKLESGFLGPSKHLWMLRWDDCCICWGIILNRLWTRFWTCI